MTGRRGASVATTEQWLRDAFTAAGETVAPGSIRGLPRPAGRPAGRPGGAPGRRLAGRPGHGRAWRWPVRAPWLREQVLVPLAAATAVTLIAVTMTVVVPKVLAGRHPAPSGGVTGVQRYDRALGGAGPRYFVGIRQLGEGSAAAAGLQVYSAITGRAVASLKPPGRGRWFQAVATFGSDGTFVAAASPRPGTNRCSTSFYRFSLGSGGRPVNVAQLSAWTVPGVVTGNSALAASANGRMVAYATQDCAAPIPAVRLGVIDVASGRSTAWTTRSKPRDLSLSANGALLSFVANPGTASAYTPRADAAWIVRTSSPPGPLTRWYRKALHPPGGVPAAALSPDGSLLFAVTGTGRPNGPGAGTIAGYDAATGTLVLLVRVLGAGNLYPAGLSVTVSGHFALVYLLRQRSVRELNLVTRQLRTVPVAAADSPVGAVW